MTPNYADTAKQLVFDCIKAESGALVEIDPDDVFVVWFCKTLQNWKALVGTTRFTDYYEVTHNGDTGETYIDVYTKTHQIIATSVPGKDS